MKTLYFIIPVYKVEQYLERCVDSVLAQSYENVKIVLVDDGSPDSCPQMCDRYGEAYTNIHVIHKPNGGLSDARNAALRYINETASPDDFITFLDSDDFVHPTFAEKMMGACENCPMLDLTLKDGIEDIIVNEIPEVREVKNISVEK